MYNRLAPKRGPSLTSNIARKPMAHGEVSIALIALGNNASNAGATAPRIRRGMGRAESQRRKARAAGAMIRSLIHTLDEAKRRSGRRGSGGQRPLSSEKADEICST